MDSGIGFLLPYDLVYFKVCLIERFREYGKFCRPKKPKNDGNIYIYI